MIQKGQVLWVEWRHRSLELLRAGSAIDHVVVVTPGERIPRIPVDLPTIIAEFLGH
jgi:hypothetical protein